MELGRPLKDIFGGNPGWLFAAVPAGQFFDLEHGQVCGPAGSFVRSKASGRWIASGENQFIPTATVLG